MSYIDGFVIPIPTKNIAKYKKMATLGRDVWMKHGALGYFECVGDEIEKSEFSNVSFRSLAKAKPSETVLFSFIIFKNKAHRNSVNKKVMKDPAMNDPALEKMGMPFDVKKMAYGGFKGIVES